MEKENNNLEILSIIVSYLTFDGHLAKDLSSFYLSSKNTETLQYFADLLKKYYKLKGRYEEGTGYGKSRKYRIFNKKFATNLESLGAPSGNKVKKPFRVPGWIMTNKECARSYLRIAFDCEGSIWFEEKPKIRFGICKSENHLADAIDFMQDLKRMLKKFGIECTKTWVTEANVRKDGVITKALYFKIKQGSIFAFSREVGFSDRFKNRRLSKISTNYPYDGII